MNGLVQFRIGLQKEFDWGWKTYLFIFLSSGIFGVLLSSLAMPNSIAVGASGAIMGILGAWIF